MGISETTWISRWPNWSYTACTNANDRLNCLPELLPLHGAIQFIAWEQRKGITRNDTLAEAYGRSIHST